MSNQRDLFACDIVKLMLLFRHSVMNVSAIQVKVVYFIGS